MKTYYMTNSISLKTKEDVVTALKEGETIMNDEARIRFIYKTRYRKPILMFQDFFESKGDWNTITPRDWSDAGIIEAMDAVVTDWNYTESVPWGENIKAVFNYL